jgi:hypothetical protein
MYPYLHLSISRANTNEIPSRERAASQLQLLSDVCDLTVPVSGLGWVALDDGVVGLAGTLSSILGIYTQWKKTA